MLMGPRDTSDRAKSVKSYKRAAVMFIFKTI